MTFPITKYIYKGTGKYKLKLYSKETKSTDNPRDYPIVKIGEQGFESTHYNSAQGCKENYAHSE